MERTNRGLNKSIHSRSPSTPDMVHACEGRQVDRTATRVDENGSEGEACVGRGEGGGGLGVAGYSSRGGRHVVVTT